MKQPIIFFAALLIMAACNQPATQSESPANTEETAAADQATSADSSAGEAAPPDSAAMMEAWMAYATPGEMHAMLAKMDGEWTGDITMWMDPSAPPAQNTGTAVNRMILGGRYQESRHTGNFMGMAFEGVSLLGFDNAKKKFVNTWVDNFGSGIMVMEGTWDEATKTMNFTGKQVDPMTGKDIDVRQVVRIIDDNTQEMEMFMKYPGAEEFKTMLIKSRRKTA